MYAVVRAGGKQYRVEEGQTVAVDALGLEKGKSVDLEVLAIGDTDQEAVRVGTPRLANVTVTAEIVGDRKGPKIHVLRYKSKVRHRKASGQRRHLTDLRITKISTR